MRHAEAENPFTVTNDFSRSLTDKGMSEASKAAKFIFDKGLVIDKLIYSSAKRTSNTAQLVGEFNQLDAVDMLADESLYNAAVGTVLDFILKLEDQWNTVLLIGHNPTFSYLAEYLSGHSPISLSPSHSVSIKFEVENWAMLTQGLGTVEWVYTGLL